MSAVPTTRYGVGEYGTGCGGEMHQLEDCAICSRRSCPTSRLMFLNKEFQETGDLTIIGRTRASWALMSAIFLVVLAVGALVLVHVIQSTSWASHDASLSMVFPLGGGYFLGAAFAVKFLFSRDCMVIDAGRRVIIESHRCLFWKSVENIIEFEAISDFTIEAFESRTWEDGKFASGERRAVAWMKLTNGGVYTLAAGDPGIVRRFAVRLSGLIGVPLRAMPQEESPTADTWEEGASG